MGHANARLTMHGRRTLIARTTGDHARPVAHVAAELGISRPCAHKWKNRFEEFGEAGLEDRSSRPHTSPNQTSPEVEDAIEAERRATRRGAEQIGAKLGVKPSTVGAVMRRRGISRLAEMDLLTGEVVREPVRRYEKDTPGELVHVDIKKLGKIRPGGGWASHGRGSEGHKASRRGANAAKVGYDMLHNAVDDHSRVAYSEILPDERKETCVAFMTRAIAFFATLNVTVTAVMTDNGSAYRSKLFTELLADKSIKHRRTRPYRPQTNGKVERFNRTAAIEWAYAREYDSSEARTAALTEFLHNYNHHRAHSALKGRPPMSRVTNVPACNS